MVSPTETNHDEMSLTERAETDPEAVDLDMVIKHVDGDKVSRKTAAAVLGELAVQAPERLDTTIPTLERLLCDDELAVRNAAAVAIERLGQTRPETVKPIIPAVIVRLNDKPSISYISLSTLATVAPIAPRAVVPAVPALKRHIQSDVADIRVKACTILAYAASKIPNAAVPLVPDLLNTLEISHYKVNEEVKRNVGADDVRAELVQGETTVRRQTEEFRAQAAHVLTIVARAYPNAVADAVPQLIILLKTEEIAPARVAFADILAFVAVERPDAVRLAIEALTDSLTSESTIELRGTAARALGNVANGYEDAVATAVQPKTASLVEILESDTTHAQASAATLLSIVADTCPDSCRTAIGPLLNLLEDEQAVVRGSAALALGSIGANRGKTELQTLADDDPVDHVRDAAVSAIHAIESDKTEAGFVR